MAAGAEKLCDYPARVQSEVEVPVPAHDFAVQFFLFLHRFFLVFFIGAVVAQRFEVFVLFF
jgi:hypothetical protein